MNLVKELSETCEGCLLKELPYMRECSILEEIAIQQVISSIV